MVGREHLVIRREDYVAGTRERPEVGIFTQTHASRHPVPWGRIAAGERVWMKWSGGPVVATARVAGFRQIEKCSPEQLRVTTAGFKLHDLDDYWAALPPVFSGLTVYLGDEQWLADAFVPAARSRGESWFVLEDDATRTAWLQAGAAEQQPGANAGRARRPSRTIPATLRFQVLRRDGFQCVYCGRKPPQVVLHVDHVVALSLGGATVLDNLRAACADCNVGKGATAL